MQSFTLSLLTVLLSCFFSVSFGLPWFGNDKALKSTKFSEKLQHLKGSNHALMNEIHIITAYLGSEIAQGHPLERKHLASNILLATRDCSKLTEASIETYYKQFKYQRIGKKEYDELKAQTRFLTRETEQFVETIQEMTVTESITYERYQKLVPDIQKYLQTLVLYLHRVKTLLPNFKSADRNGGYWLREAQFADLFRNVMLFGSVDEFKIVTLVDRLIKL